MRPLPFHEIYINQNYKPVLEVGCGSGWELIPMVPAQKKMAPPCYVSVGLSM